MDFKVSLKAARVNANMKQVDAAQKLGVSKESIANWERGKVAPKATMLIRLCQIYEVPVDYIFLP